MVRAAEEENGSIVSKSKAYLEGSIQELKKVSHPTRQETFKVTAVTLGFVLLTSLCLCVLDIVFAYFMSYL